jgi:uncharacterized protein involved in outer membrane biogenesis
MQVPASYKKVTWIAALVLMALIAIGIALVTHLREPLAHLISKRYGRDIRIEGPLHAHLFSLHPGLIAERITIGNPPWISPGTMAHIGKLTVRFDLPWGGRPFALRELRLEGLELQLKRNIDGYANWYWKPPGTVPGRGAPLIYRLSLPHAHVTLDDERRHLNFDGTLTTEDAEDAAKLRITATGRLNDRDFALRLTGDPLATVARNKPYGFELEEHSSGSELTSQGSVLQPFDFRLLEATFAAHGADLKDLYFLIGAILPDTGPYRLSGRLTRHYTTFTLSDLAATSGGSDIGGKLVSHLFESGKAHTDIELHSRRLRIADLGLRAAGRAGEPPEDKPLLLPQKEIPLTGLRRSNSNISYHARELEVGHLSLRSVRGSMSIEYGEVNVPTLSAALSDGEINAHGKFDARSAKAAANLDVRLANVRVGQLFRKHPDEPPLEGPLDGHLNVSGRGRSVHEMAASLNGTLRLFLPGGVMRASLAELAGANLRGLQLTLSKSKKEAAIRCAVARFQARDGTLVARQLMIDTDRMLITGAGDIQLGTEALDLRIQGEPKHLRLLRLSGPLLVQGTLAHPKVTLDKHDRKLELIDPGHAADSDCTRPP